MNFKDKKILVTGGKGFLGTHLVHQLRKNEQVLEKNIFIAKHKDYDLREQSDIKKLLKDTSPEIIIHLAAKVGGIGYNQNNPATLFYDNLLMGVQLIEQARLNDIEKFVAVGTICAYPKFTKVPFNEEDLWNGYPEETNAPYGLAKKMMLVQSQAYRQQYGFNSIYLLPVNLYGPNDNFDLNNSHVIPALIRKFTEAKENNLDEVILWGTGNASREFLYVEDCANAIIKATQQYNKSNPINLGSGLEIRIKTLANKINNLIGFKGNIIWDTTKPDGQPRRCLDISKAEKEFGFKAQTYLNEGLKKTIEWYTSQAQ